MTEIAALLDDTEAELAPLEREAYLAEWDVALEATKKGENALVESSLKLDAVLADPERYRALSAAVEGGTLSDALLSRRTELLRANAERRQRPRELAERIVRLEASLQSTYSSHRGQVDGEPVDNNTIERILRDSTDLELRHKAWEASRTIGPIVAPQVRELARLRNESARALGYRDHFAMSLALDELDEGWLMGLLDDLDSGLEAAWARELAAIQTERRAVLGLSAEETLRPWHYTDMFFQETVPLPGDPLEDALEPVDGVEVARAYFEALGDPMEGVLARSDLYPRERKNQHAFCISIDRADDVRVLCNVVPGERWTETTLHELGHAAYDVAIDRALPWTLRTPSHIFTTEAIAMLHGRQTRRAAFLTRFAGLSEELATNALHAHALRRGLLVFVPWVQVMTRFEQALYADPDADLGAIWWQLVERYQRVAAPGGERPDDWASKLHIALAPVYYQNYLLGQVTASQLEGAIERETGDVSPAADPQRAGAFLRDRFMRTGASLRWDALIEEATGAPLNSDRFVAELTGG